MTPPPTPLPVRPAPVAFNVDSFYDALLQAQSNMVQIGGLLDRVTQNGPQSCEDYNQWYDGLVTSPVYTNVPEEWNATYGDYIWSVEHALNTNDHLSGICRGGGGQITDLEYGEARIGIHKALERLNPAVDRAKGMLGR